MCRPFLLFFCSKLLKTETFYVFSSFLLEASLFPTALCPQEGQNLFVASNRLPHAEQNMLIFNIKALKDIILLSFDKNTVFIKTTNEFSGTCVSALRQDPFKLS